MGRSGQLPPGAERPDRARRAPQRQDRGRLLGIDERRFDRAGAGRRRADTRQPAARRPVRHRGVRQPAPRAVSPRNAGVRGQRRPGAPLRARPGRRHGRHGDRSRAARRLPQRRRTRHGPRPAADHRRRSVGYRPRSLPGAPVRPPHLYRRRRQLGRRAVRARAGRRDRRRVRVGGPARGHGPTHPPPLSAHPCAAHPRGPRRLAGLRAAHRSRSAAAAVPRRHHAPVRIVRGAAVRTGRPGDRVDRRPHDYPAHGDRRGGRRRRGRGGCRAIRRGAHRRRATAAGDRG